ncbi:MAG: hypothetical protein IJP79_01840 [Paludibacteraceae bacterium]|nr:hypothetical protein [Paludibacteraceae bacterium]MBQ7747755.1 hypothetical protein [Paludibacteraceae bacterium]
MDLFKLDFLALFLAWGKWRKGWLKTTLPISFQFHHAQMDGIPGGSTLIFEIELVGIA